MEGIFALVIMFWLMKLLSQSARKKKKSASATANRLVKEPPVRPQPLVQEQPLGEGQSSFAADRDDPHARRFEYMGSMNVDSDEGEDVCDPSLAHDREERFDPQSVYANEIGAEPLLDLSPKGLYQGVVMSEILTRPARRGH